MGWGDWMATSNSLERQAQIEIDRRYVRGMPEEQLRAFADHLVVQSHNQAAVLRNAMRRIAELEVKEALINVSAIAASLEPRQHHLNPVSYCLDRWRRWRQQWRPTTHQPTQPQQ